MFRTRRISRIVSVFFVGILALSSIFADGVKQKIRFAKGASSATVSGAVVRGDSDRYYVGAKKGQTMSVKITSEEDNAVFQIYLPGEEKALHGAGDGDDATNWSGGRATCRRRICNRSRRHARQCNV
ncbi:MAG TPA: hypothetical protein VK557_13610 [Pyrinomonadaceae bacterium]|nr:hypothetical protein [Pyrinomonadaceae bacterium]